MRTDELGTIRPGMGMNSQFWFHTEYQIEGGGGSFSQSLRNGSPKNEQ